MAVIVVIALTTIGAGGVAGGVVALGYDSRTNQPEEEEEEAQHEELEYSVFTSK